MAHRRNPKEVFISHSSGDLELASRIADELEIRGFPAWFSPAKLRGAQEWHDEIGKALARCDWFVVLLTPDSVQSPWVKRELVYAFSEKRYGGRIIPVIVRPCDPGELSWVLRTIQQIDVTDAPDTAAAKIAAVW